MGTDYYLTGTTMHAMPGLPVLLSKDLVNWTFLTYTADTLDLGPAYRLEDGKSIYGQGHHAAGQNQYRAATSGPLSTTYDHEYKLFQSRVQVNQKVADYLAHFPSFEKWQADQFAGLAMYIQLIDSFGWVPIEQVYRQYRQLPRSQYPATEAAKRDLWFTAISTATHRNLAPFFAQWRVPVGKAAAKAVASYPAWLPSEMRPK